MIVNMPTEQEMAYAQQRIAEMKEMKAQYGSFFGRWTSA